MMRPTLVLIVLTVSACASSTPPPLDPVKANASLPAAEFGALVSWQALRDGSILIEGAGKKYHRATFTAPCAGLAGAQAVAVKVSKFGSEDRVQGVTINPAAGGAETCYFNALEPVDDPKSLAIAAPSAPVEGRPLPAPGQ